MYNMVAYILKVMHVEDDISNVSLSYITYICYPGEDTRCVKDHRIFIIDNKNSYNNIISKNTDIRRNNIPESTYSIPSSLHISGAKYSIY